MTKPAGGVHEGLAAAILAGGAARRFGGADKASVDIGGQRLADRIVAALRPVAGEIFVVGRPSRAWSDHALTVIGDQIPGAGALGGIYTAIVASPFDRTLVVGCDMPFLSPEFLRLLAAIDADLVIPRSARGREPLCAVYGKACAAPIRERIESGALAASALPPGVRVAEVGPEVLAAYDPEGLMFVNVNTPHDYEQVRKWYHRTTTNS